MARNVCAAGWAALSPQLLLPWFNISLGTKVLGWAGLGWLGWLGWYQDTDLILTIC